jgi:hypothetical protein
MQTVDVKLAGELIRQLGQLGCPVRLCEEWLAETVEEMKSMPSEADLRWPRVSPVVIAEHVTLGDDRPMLNCGLAVGRAYSLTPGQRDVIREWFNVTPAPLIEVVNVTMFDDGVHIRSVRLKSVEHVDPRRRRMLVQFCINSWGEFMSLAKQYDDDRQAVLDNVIPEDEVVKPGKKTPKSNQTKLLQDLMGQYGI